MGILTISAEPSANLMFALKPMGCGPDFPRGDFTIAVHIAELARWGDSFMAMSSFLI